MEINDAIKALRQERGMSIRQLADATGVSKTTIVNIEQGHKSASVDTVNKILDYLGCRLTITEQ